MNECYRRRNLYTVYREPEHVAILERRAAWTCEKWFREHLPEVVPQKSGWRNLVIKLKDGKVPGYSVLTETRRDAGYGEQKDLEMSKTVDEESEGTEERKRICVRLCGNCSEWMPAEKREQRTGKLWGLCRMDGKARERCAVCAVRK